MRGSKDLISGRGKLILLSGIGGIGKTALAQTFAAESESAGRLIYWANCWEREGTPPYWHWIQLLRQAIATLDQNTVTESVRRSIDYIRRLVPEFESIPSANIPAEPASSELRPDEWPARDRFKLFDGICHFLRIAATSKPLVAIFDDLHLADRDSLELLLFVAREIQQFPVLLVGIFRNDSLPSDTRKDLDSLQRFGQTLILGGFDVSEVDRFSRKHGLVLPSSTISHLTELTGGSPFFLVEALQLLEKTKVADAALFLESQPLVSDRIRNIVRERLKPLSVNTVEALSVAAVIGREFELDLLSVVLGRKLPELFEMLAEAVDHQLVEQSTPGSGGYRFIQPMVAETITSIMPPRQFSEFHCKVGEALERRFAQNLEPVLPRLATHFLRAGSLAPQEKALKYALQSSQRAMLQLAYDEAERLAVLGIETCRSGLAPDPEILCEFQIILGQARSRLGRLDNANEHFFEAAATARHANRPDLLARAALKVSPAVGVGSIDRRVIALLEEAIRTADADDSRLRARLLAKLASSLYWSARRADAESMSRKAVSAARESEDPETLIFALLRNHYALWSPDNLVERLHISAQMVELSEGLDDLEWATRAHEIRIADLLEHGDIAAVDIEKEIYRELSKQFHEEDGSVEMIDGTLALLRGRFKQAEDLATQAFQKAQRWQHPRALLSYAAQLAMVRFHQGRIREMLPLLDQYVATYPRIDLLRCALALASIENDSAEQARVHFEYFATNDFASLEKNWNWLATIVVASEVCVFLKDKQRALLLYRLLFPYAARNVMLGWYEACFGSASRILGSLASLLRNFDDAEKHFTDALAMNQRIGAIPWIAHNQRNYAAMLLDRSAPGDEEKALVLIKAAMATSRTLALREVEKGLTSLLRRLNKEDQATVSSVGNTHDSGSGLHSTVTLMFSDIVDSTKLVEALGDLQAQELMREHDRVVREAVSRHNGREVKTLGDGFMIAFGSARQAVQCAVEIQRSISTLSSPQESKPLRVRVGLHTGEPLNDAGDFFGKAVIVAARVSAQAGPGEILVSETVKDLTENAGDLHFDRGREVRLKGLDRAYRLFRLIVDESD